ncbi:hypothetical protein ACO0LC_18710 [Undibacterium sp. JH2W]|uniref:hypothetical protein n=1 Tax=Undibacterium sp. JH2W TaxID=3413037 RepID=UPI003BEF722F
MFLLKRGLLSSFSEFFAERSHGLQVKTTWSQHILIARAQPPIFHLSIFAVSGHALMFFKILKQKQNNCFAPDASKAGVLTE